jgi:hypothetical protein
MGSTEYQVLVTFTKGRCEACLAVPEIELGVIFHCLFNHLRHSFRAADASSVIAISAFNPPIKGLATDGRSLFMLE